MYNKTLAAERDIARKVAEEQGVGFADVFDPMVEVMEKAKAKYGHAYHLAGGDGVHPDANGHLVMAYAFLKGLGCKGDVGTITVDLAANKAEATDGHQVKGVKDGEVEIESSRYPFCFYGDDLKTTGSTKGVIEFLPFNQDLNRLTLVVHNAPAGQEPEGHLGQGQQDVLRRATGQGDQPGGGVPGQPVQRAVQEGGGGHQAAAELRDAAGEAVDPRPAGLQGGRPEGGGNAGAHRRRACSRRTRRWWTPPRRR